MIRITKFFYIHILLVPMIILSYYLGSVPVFMTAFGVVLIHELFHLFAAILVGVNVKSIVVLPFGMTLRLSGDVIKKPKKEIAIALAGPAANVLMLVFSQFAVRNEKVLLFQVVNWSILLLNLFPIAPLDGGRILRALIIKNSGLMGAASILRKVSKVFIFIVLVLGVIALILTQGNPSLMIIGAFLIFSTIEEKKTSDLLVMHSLIGEKEMFKSKNLIPTKNLCISFDTPAKAVIKKLNFSTFYIVYILDKNRKIIKTATESDFIRAVKSKGFSVKSCEI